MDDILNEKFQRRTLILGGIQGGLFLGLVGNLYRLQVLENKHYKNLSDKNRIHNFLILPDRGLIVDHKNTILAHSKNTYIAYFDRTQVQDIPILVEKLKQHITLNEQDENWIYKQLKTKTKIEPIIIKEQLTYAEVSKIEYFLSELSGVYTDNIRSREYLNPEPFAHVVGFVSSISQHEKTKNSALLMAPGFQTGKTGIEKFYNDSLVGRPGAKKVEVNAYRKVVRTLAYEKSIPGDNLVLNIDSKLQLKIYELLMKHNSGACAVMDVHTGALRAFASAPGFDTNLFVNKLSHQNWNDLSHNIHRPLINKLTSGLYAPGSIFKMLVALSALEKGSITSAEKVHCPGHYDVNNHKFHCWTWKTGGHGYVNLIDAIASSCDVYFYKLANKLKVDDIANMAKRFGFGSITGLEIAHEKAGLIPTAAWKKAKYGKRWSMGETINVTIGQGAVLCTPMQILRMMAALVNGGKLVTPRLVESTPEQSSIISVNQQHLGLIKQGMHNVLNHASGTAFNSRSKNKNFEIGGKTSTTQVVRITEEQRKKGLTKNSRWDLREHAFFAGYGPTHDAKFATIVFVEHGEFGSKTAAPIGRDALLLAQEILG
ncbi:MAG: penicillin-binding protein 2 [Alphaproteobacteria bacterium CG_4_10_14_0_8_um_filter_37_21]|nr:MAG: penicillin-binding protein 2 [Alphaproteobacteria bacterium CG_4_10_14_0_8_um_filter_37_21]